MRHLAIEGPQQLLGHVSEKDDPLPDRRAAGHRDIGLGIVARSGDEQPRSGDLRHDVFHRVHQFAMSLLALAFRHAPHNQDVVPGRGER